MNTKEKRNYTLDDRKMKIYAYIYKVEEFFRKYNEKYFGATLYNFYGIDEIPIKKYYTRMEEDICNKNMLYCQLFINNACLIPFIKFNTSHTVSYTKDNNFKYNYTRTITLLKDDIKTSSYKQINSAHEELIKFIKGFLNLNYLNEKYFSSNLEPNNKDIVAYAYIKRLEELFGIDKYNAEMPEKVYKAIFEKEMSIVVPFIEFERRIRVSTVNKVCDNESYYCVINYKKILNNTLEILIDAHYKLDEFIKDMKKMYEEYVDERRRSPKYLKFKPKERGINIV